MVTFGVKSIYNLKIQQHFAMHMFLTSGIQARCFPAVVEYRFDVVVLEFGVKVLGLCSLLVFIMSTATTIITTTYSFCQRSKGKKYFVPNEKNLIDVNGFTRNRTVILQNSEM